MYFRVMSLGLGLDGRLALDAIDACDRLRQQILDAVARHEHAAALATPDWEGPHRDEFDDRFAGVQARLRDCEDWVVLVRRLAGDVLTDAQEQVREATAATTRVRQAW